MIPFEDDEKLLRAVRNWPRFWKKDGRLSELAFKTRDTEKGTSVYRQARRSLDESIKAITLEGAIVSVTYKQCIDLKIRVEETSSETHHCDLTDSNLTNGSTALTAVQRQNLADFAVIEKK